MSENIDLILLILTCFIILIFHVIADNRIFNGYDSGKEINRAIIKDIAIIIIYLFIRYTVINLLKM